MNLTIKNRTINKYNYPIYKFVHDTVEYILMVFGSRLDILWDGTTIVGITFNVNSKSSFDQFWIKEIKKEEK